MVILCILGIILGGRYLHGVLEDYEASQPVYTAQEAARILGQPSEAIVGILGYVDEPELVHRDNMVLV